MSREFSGSELKVLFVTHGFPPSEVAGTELLARSVGRQLARKGNEIIVFCPAFSPELEAFSIVDGMEVHRVFVSPNEKTKFSDTYVDDAINYQFAKLVLEIRPNIALVWHTISLSAGILEVLSRMSIPYVLFLADFYYMCHKVHLLTASLQPCDGPGDGTKCKDCILATVPQSFLDRDGFDAAQLGRTRVAEMQELLRNATAIVAPSNFVKEKYLEFGVAANKMRVINPGVDTKTILSTYNHSQGDRLRFGYLGGNVEHKGISVLLEAFSSIQDKAELLIAGLWMDRPLPAHSISHVRNMGMYSPQDIGRILSEIDVLIFPSTCHESYGLVIREAFATKIPVIVSDLRAQSDAVRDGVDGLQFRSTDASDLASKMTALIRNPEKLQGLRHRIRSVPDIDDTAERIERLLMHVSNSTGRKVLTRTRVIMLQERIARLQVDLLELRSTTRMRELEFTKLRDENLRLHEEEAKRNSTLTELQNETGRLQNENLRLHEEEAKRNSTLTELQNEKLRMQLEITSMHDDLRKLHEENLGLGSELATLKRSVGYTVMKFYARRIDRLFPDGTRRGDFRRRIVKRLNNPNC